MNKKERGARHDASRVEVTPIDPKNNNCAPPLPKAEYEKAQKEKE